MSPVAGQFDMLRRELGGVAGAEFDAPVSPARGAHIAAVHGGAAAGGVGEADERPRIAGNFD